MRAPACHVVLALLTPILPAAAAPATPPADCATAAQSGSPGAPTKPGGQASEAAPVWRIDLTYRVRLLIPAGSTVTLVARGPGDVEIARAETLTRDSDARIPLRLALGTAPAYPVRLEARLASTAGHVLTGSADVAADPVEPVCIALAPSDSR